MGELDRIWAGWRAAYVADVSADDSPLAPDARGSLFERILAMGDDEGSYVVHRGPTCSTLLNLYPYTSGHLLVLPNRAVPDLDGLEPGEFAELWEEVRDARVALGRAYAAEGINVGLNLGREGGAGVPDHLHVHVVPRWSGDTNFMTTTASTRVLPEPLSLTWRKLRDAWRSPL